MLERLKNIWKLGEYKVEKTPKGQELVPTRQADSHPKGKARIVETDDIFNRIFES